MDADKTYPALAGKVLYAFGDSIVDGHLYTRRSCVDIVGERAGMTVLKYARNGATVLPSVVADGLGGQILAQAELVGVDMPAPDAIVFDGGTNDAFPAVIPAHLGGVDPEAGPAELDLSTYAGCFEATICAFRRHWPQTPIVYLTVARLGSRDWAIQNYQRQVALAGCAKWGVTVADVFACEDFDPRRDDDRRAYSFDLLGADGLPGTPETVTYPDPARQPSGTHPNFAAIERFYAPILLDALERAVCGA